MYEVVRVSSISRDRLSRNYGDYDVNPSGQLNHISSYFSLIFDSRASRSGQKCEKNIKRKLFGVHSPWYITTAAIGLS